MTYALIEAEWVVACAEVEIRLEQLNGLLGDF